jgi:hypothetical protein
MPTSPILSAILKTRGTKPKPGTIDDVNALKLLLAETFVYTDYGGSFTKRDEWLSKVQSEEQDDRALANVEQSAASMETQQ